MLFIYKFIQRFIYFYIIIVDKVRIMQESKIIHYPSLKTVLMVEKAIKESEDNLTREKLKKRLPKKVMHQTLNVVLEYLEDSGKILDGRKGIIWTQNNNENLRRLEKEGIRV